MLNRLYKHTSWKEAQHDHAGPVDSQPKVLNLHEILSAYLKHQRSPHRGPV